MTTTIADVWPLFALRLRTPRLELRPARDEDLPGLVDAALAGVHDPDVMPFGVPWTDAPPEDLPAAFAKHLWDQRGRVAPESWTVEFAVLEDGVPIGVQELSAQAFAVRRTVTSGSWLTLDRHGRGLGTEMRAALLLFAFDHLEAEFAESGALTWNTASLGVSRKLGYRDNGTARVQTRPGHLDEEQLVRLAREDFLRPEWELRVDGVDAARRALVR